MNKKRKRDHALLLRFSSDEMAFLQKKMEEAGIENREAYLRKMALDGYIIRQDYTVLNKFIYELNRIGNTLNQIAKTANTYGIIDSLELKGIQNDLNKLWQKLSSIG
jgi:hypothetical protein